MYYSNHVEEWHGDIEIDGISTQGFLLNNSNGYATISSVTADNMEVFLGSGNITIKKAPLMKQDRNIFQLCTDQ